MKKKNYLWVFGLLLSFMTLGFSSCSDDDAPGSSADLVGTWQSVSYIDWYKENGKIIDQSEDEDEDYRIRFNEDGTAEHNEKYNGKWYDPEYIGTWKYKGGKIYFYYDDEGEYITVKELTSSQMVWEYYDKYTEKGVTYEEYYREVFRKISD